MTCPSCGAENLEDALFCMRCGTELKGERPAEETPGVEPAEPRGVAAGEPEAPAGQPQPPAVPPSRRPLLGAVRPSGWGTALLRGVLAFVIMGLLAEALGALTLLDAELSVATLLKSAALFFFGFNHIGVRFDLPSFDFTDLGGLPTEEVPPDLEGLGALGSLDVSASVAVAMLLATGLAVWLLYRGGRAAAVAAGGPPLGRVAVGASVGLPYALLSLALSFLVRFSFDIPGEIPFLTGGDLEIGPGPVSALLWPLLLGGLAGAAGGFREASGSLISGLAGRRVVGVLSGARRMVVVALAVAFAGLFVLSAANPSAFIEYFEAVGQAGAREGFLLILYTALLVPNMLIGLIFMGSGSGVVAGDYVDNGAITFFSLPRFIEGFDQAGLTELDPLGLAGQGIQPGFPFSFGVAPPEYFVFILAPLAGVILGGRYAARRGAAATAGEGAGLGAGAGVVFAVAMMLLAILAGVGFRFTLALGLEQTSIARFGPSVLFGSLIALGWGVVGGAIGGALGSASPAGEAAPGGPPEADWRHPPEPNEDLPEPNEDLPEPNEDLGPGPRPPNS